MKECLVVHCILMSNFTYIRHCPDLQRKKKQNICKQNQTYTEAAVQQLKAQSDEYRL